jgi:hypothetical protein
MMRPINSRKRSGVVGDLVSGTGGLIVSVIVILVIISTLLGANLLSTGGVDNATAHSLASNLTKGINNVSGKIPTILLIAAVVLLFGVIVLLVKQSQAMGIGGGRGGTL